MPVFKVLSNDLVAESTLSEEELKNLVLRTLPNPNKFVFAECTNCLSCYIRRVHLSIYLMDDGFQYSATYCDTEQLKGWMLYRALRAEVRSQKSEVRSQNSVRRRRGLF